MATMDKGLAVDAFCGKDNRDKMAYSEQTKEQFWDKVYNMDGRSLAYHLHEFTGLEVHATRYGEEVWYESDEFYIFTWRWGRWDKWRENVSYYFSAFFGALEETGLQLSEDEAEAILVYGVASACGILDDLAGHFGCAPMPPQHYDKFLFC